MHELWTFWGSADWVLDTRNQKVRTFQENMDCRQDSETMDLDKELFRILFLKNTERIPGHIPPTPLTYD